VEAGSAAVRPSELAVQELSYRQRSRDLMRALQATAGQLETAPHPLSMVPAAAAPTQRTVLLIQSAS